MSLTYGSVCSGIERRTCTACGVAKPLNEFGRQRAGRGGHRAWCLPCARADSRRHYHLNREHRLARVKGAMTADPERHRAARRRQKLQRLYGLSEEALASMRARQQGCCAICAEARPLKIDHCHDTGKVRALLCGPCNTSLGAFRDDPALLDRAAAYLREHGR